MPAICRALLAALVACVCVQAAMAVAHGQTRPQQVAEEAAKRRPMTFFLAKGSTNACGPGCSEWIAAEGVLDPAAAARFQAFLTGLNRDGLPVFFNSPGGSVSQSVLIGMILRERRMSVAIGRTRPEGCSRGQGEESCHRVMQAKPEHRARLTIDGARCFSACTYAFLGGSARKVGRGALLGVHSAFPRAGASKRDSGPAMVEHTHKLLRRYSVVMGVDSRLIDVAAQVRPEKMHRVSSAELARFGVETNGFFETRWISYQESGDRLVLLKSVTQRNAANSAEYLTSFIRIGCNVAKNAPFVSYRRELPRTTVAYSGSIRAIIGDHALPFVGRETANSVETGVTSTELAVLERAAAATDISVAEDMRSPSGTPDGTRVVKLSTVGLPEALTEFRKHCTAARVSQAPALINP